MAELTPIPAEHRAIYYDALRAGRAEAERLGVKLLDDRIFIAFHRALYRQMLDLATGQAITAAAGQQPARPRVVALCGSTRFKAEFGWANRVLTLAGYIVVAPGVFGHADGIELTDEQKAALDALHLRKIDMADEVIVVNPGGYIGDSTRAEIAYAKQVGKPVGYLGDVPAEIEEDGRG